MAATSITTWTSSPGEKRTSPTSSAVSRPLVALRTCLSCTAHPYAPRLPKGKWVRVDGNTASILSSGWLKGHFQVRVAGR